MGKNQKSVVVFWIWMKFWYMIPMGVKYNHTKCDRETRRWRPATGFASGRPPFQNLTKMARKCLFWAVWVPRICVKGSICIGTNLNDKQTSFIIV